jgi:hypothetical protein
MEKNARIITTHIKGEPASIKTIAIRSNIPIAKLHVCFKLE